MNSQDQYLTNISFQHNTALNQQNICNHNFQNCDCTQFSYIQDNQNDQDVLQKYDDINENKISGFEKNQLNHEHSYDYNKNQSNQNELIQNSASQGNENSHSYFINQEGKQKRKYSKKGVINLKTDKINGIKKVKEAKAGRWTQFEKQQFVDGLKQFGKDWKKVEKVIKTRTGAQIRSHAQKFFMNVRTTYKMGIDEYVNYIQQNLTGEENQKMGLDFDSNNDNSSFISQKDFQKQNQQTNFQISSEEKEIQINYQGKILNEENQSKYEINAPNFSTENEKQFIDKKEIQNNQLTLIKDAYLEQRLDIISGQKQNNYEQNEQTQLLDNKQANENFNSNDFQKQSKSIEKQQKQQMNSEITVGVLAQTTSKQTTPTKNDIGSLLLKQNEIEKQKDQNKKIQQKTIFATLKLTRNPKSLIQTGKDHLNETLSPALNKKNSTNASIEITRQEKKSELTGLFVKERNSSSKVNNPEQKQDEKAKFQSTVTFCEDKSLEEELMDLAYVETNNFDVGQVFDSLWSLKSTKKGSKIDNMQLYSSLPSKLDQVIYPLPDQLRQLATLIQIDPDQVKVSWHLNKFELSIFNLSEYSSPVYIFTIFENKGSSQMAKLKRFVGKSDHKDIIINHGTLIKLYGQNINQFIFEVPKVSSQEGDLIGRRISLLFYQNQQQSDSLIKNTSEINHQKFFSKPDLPNLLNMQNSIPNSGKTPQFGFQSLLKPNLMLPFGIENNILNLNNDFNFNLFNQSLQQQAMNPGPAINNFQSYFSQQSVQQAFNRLNTQNSEFSNNSKSNSRIAKIRNMNSQNKSPRTTLNQAYQSGNNIPFFNQQLALQATQQTCKFSPLTIKNQLSQNNENQNQFLSQTNLKSPFTQFTVSAFAFDNKKSARERTLSGILNSRILSAGTPSNNQNVQSPKVKSQQSQNECLQNFQENTITREQEQKQQKQGIFNRLQARQSAFVASSANNYYQTLTQSKKQLNKILNDKNELFNQNQLDQKSINDKNINQANFEGLTQQQIQKSLFDNNQKNNEGLKITKHTRDLLSPSKNLTFAPETQQQPTNSIIEPKLNKQAISNVTFAGHEILRHLPIDGNQRQNQINQSLYKNSFKDIKAGLLRENDQSLKQDYLGTNYERRTPFLNKIGQHDHLIRQMVYGKAKLAFPSRNVSEFSDRSVVSNIMSQYTNQNNYKSLKNPSPKRPKNLDENHAIQDQPLQFIQKEQEEKDNLLIKISGLASRRPSNTSDVSKISNFFQQETKLQKVEQNEQTKTNLEELKISDQAYDTSVKFLPEVIKQNHETSKYMQISRFNNTKPEDQPIYYHENIEQQPTEDNNQEFEYDYNNNNLNWVQIEAKWSLIFLEFNSILNEIVFNQFGKSSNSIDNKATLTRQIIDNLFEQVDSIYTEMVQLYQLYSEIQNSQSFNCFQENQKQDEQSIQKGLVRMHVCISQNLTMQTLLKSLLFKLQFQEQTPVYHIQKENLGYLITLRVKEFSKYSEQHNLTQQMLKKQAQIVKKKVQSKEYVQQNEQIHFQNQDEFFKNQILNEQLQKTSEKINEEIENLKNNDQKNQKEGFNITFKKIVSSLSPEPERLLTQQMTEEELKKMKGVSFDDPMRFLKVRINQEQKEQRSTPDNSSLDYLQKRQKLSDQTSGLKQSLKDSYENKREEKQQEKEKEKEERVRKGGFRQEAYSDCLPTKQDNMIDQKHEKPASNHLY